MPSEINKGRTTERLGFSSGGAISSRTVMRRELERLLAVVPIEADAASYRRAVLEDNVLDKTTGANREKTFNFLRRLYALDPQVCLFREMRRLLPFAVGDASLLMGLLAMAREPILRDCLNMVLKVPLGEGLGRVAFEAWVRAYAPGRYSDAMYVSFSHNLYASFFQIGYLGESIGTTRGRRTPGPAWHPQSMRHSSTGSAG